MFHVEYSSHVEISKLYEEIQLLHGKRGGVQFQPSGLL